MSLENFQLPAFLAGELYRNSMVDLDSQQVLSKSLKGEKPVFLGNNARNILIIVNDNNAVYLQDDDLNFLIGILTACKLTLADTALVNTASNPAKDYKSLISYFKPQTILSFGIDLSALDFPLAFPEYQVQQYNSQSYLAAPTLAKLSADKQEKLQLWNCLKKIFSI